MISLILGLHIFLFFKGFYFCSRFVSAFLQWSNFVNIYVLHMAAPEVTLSLLSIPVNL